MLFGPSPSASSAPDDVKWLWFNKYDADGGGTIDCDELAALLRDCGHKNLAAADVEKLFAEADADSSGGIDFNEFEQMIATLEARYSTAPRPPTPPPFSF